MYSNNGNRDQKRRTIRLIGAAAVVALIVLAVAATQSGALSQSNQPSAPFKSTSSIAAYNQGSNISLAFRGNDNKYSLFSFGTDFPYGLLSSAQSFMTFLSGGFKLGPQSSAGPTGVGLASQNVAVGDFVGDGSAGVAFVDVTGFSPNISVYQGSTSFFYSGEKSYKVGSYPAGVIAADFNKDGKLDLAVPFLGDGSTPGGVAVLISQGAAGFAPAVIYSSGMSPFGVSAFDLNGDGILDLAVTDDGSEGSGGGAFVLMGKGDGTFTQSTEVYTAGNSFASSPLTVTAADFNGDGHPDLALGVADGTVLILLNRGNGTFSTGSSTKAENSIVYIAAGDFNGDGHLDLATAEYDGTVSVLQGDGNGNFQLRSAYIVSHDPDSLIITDYNGDGKLDLINGLGDARGFGPSDGSGNIDILLGNGDGTFQAAAVYPTGGTPSEAVTGDFNGDGKPDIAVAIGYGKPLPVLLGNGDGTFNITTGASSNDASLTTGDFNLDGKLDIATSSQVFLGKGDGTFQDPMPLPVTGTVVRSGDFNGDGKPDLALIDRASGMVSILVGGGNGSFQPGQTYTVGMNPTRLVISDFNRDGKLDLAVLSGFGNGNPASVSILLGKGDGTFNNPLATFNGVAPYFDIVAGDFNGDGIPDLAVSYEETDTSNPPFIGILLGNGDGTFKAVMNTTLDYGNPSAMGVGDFNGDGKIDLLVTGVGTTNLLYLAGNGDGTFQPWIPFEGGSYPRSFTVADLNNDQRPDVVITNSPGGFHGSVVPLLNSSGGNGPVIDKGGVINGGSFDPQAPIAPGVIVSIFGSNLAPGNAVATDIPLPLNLNNVSVTINGEQAPLYFVSSRQINVQAPWDLNTSGPAQVVVNNSGANSPPEPAKTQGVSPAVLAYLGHAIAINLDGYLAAASGAIQGLTTHPVARGQAIILYTTGLGAVDHDIAKGGIPASGTLVYAKVKPTVLLNGTAIPDSDVIFWGLTPQFVGVNQVNIIIPPDAPTGDSVSIQISSGGLSSPANAATLAIQ